MRSPAPPGPDGDPPAAAPRLHAVDNLRATMMWLGVVLHVADLHVVGQSPLAWHDPARSVVANLLVFVIHAFRMPVFFIVAGFFALLLARRYGLSGMLAHRGLRIGVPLLIFWPPLFAAMVALSTLHAQPSGAVPVPGFDLASMPLMPDGSRLQTMHLWFLQLLLGLAAATAVAGALAQRLPPQLRERVARALVALLLHPLALVLLAGVLALNSQDDPYGVLVAWATVVPRRQEWLHYGIFFGYGLVLYAGRERVLPLLQQRCAAYGLLGTLLMAATTVAMSAAVGPSGTPRATPQQLWLAMAYNGVSWLWSLALIGAYTRWLNRQSALPAYLAESSYWVYLVHLPCLVAVDLVLRVWTAPALLKMGVNVLITTAVCLASYQLLVRHTLLGVLLNGRRGGAPQLALPRIGPPTTVITRAVKDGSSSAADAGDA